MGANNCATQIPGRCIRYTAQQHVDVVQSTLAALRRKGIRHVVWYQWLDSGPVSPENATVQRLGLQPVLAAVVHGVPTAPTGLHVVSRTPTSVSLRWTPAGDRADDGDPASPHGVTSYHVHRGTTRHYYKVTAEDATWQVGGASNEVVS